MSGLCDSRLTIDDSQRRHSKSSIVNQSTDHRIIKVMAATAPHILITAGPTHEPIDAVRYLANRSSGQMGLALAKAATDRGWPTTLLLGPTPLSPPQSSCLRTIRFQTTADLQHLLKTHWPQYDVLFMAAAVADFRPAMSSDQRSANSDQPPLTPHGNAGLTPTKIKRTNQALTLELEPTPDLLAELAATTQPHQTVIGFALEPADRLLESAREKLVRKNLHAIVANPLQTMDSATIDATVFLKNGESLSLNGERSKTDFAHWLLDQLPRIAGRK